ncbi:hypothetical protein NMY22_g11731 [Coprinellus aureogranulatus]|nr:hypothetical protein NMY22_g11731 [Coprinellus aureogranulatus]
MASRPSLERKSGSIDKEKHPDEIDLKEIEAVALPDFDDPNIDREAAIQGVLEDDSPYPEVRAAVANTDDPTIPVSTIRSWTLGLVWAIIIAGLNQFFFFRYPSVTISSLVAQLLIFPIGRIWAKIVPNVKIFGAELNPGPFSIKEHVLATIMAIVGAYSAYATDIVAVQRVFYNQNYNFSYQWLLVMSTQLIGFSIGGIARRFLVQPPSMIWPTNLVTCALFNTLPRPDVTPAPQPGRYLQRAVLLALSYFSWVTWIAPDNIPVNQMFGYLHGMGMSLITFDWAQIAYIGSPLATPWWAEANIAVGFVFFFWILTPVLYYTNTWDKFPVAVHTTTWPRRTTSSES